MTLDELREECLKIRGIDKVRKARLKDGIFLKYKPVIVILSNGAKHVFSDFVSRDTADFGLPRTKLEHERFYDKGGVLCD